MWGVGFRYQGVTRSRNSAPGLRVEGSGFGVLEFRDQGLGFGVSGCSVQCLGLRVEGPGFQTTQLQTFNMHPFRSAAVGPSARCRAKKGAS
jgi:hypothetical protein